MSRLWSAAPLLLTLASLFWAGNFVLGRAVGTGAAGDLGPVALAFWRWVAAFALVLALGGRLAWRERREIARAWPFLLFAGLMSVSAYNTLIYVGLQSTPVLNALLLQSAIPVLILVAGFASLLALLFFNRGVALIGAARAGGFLHLMPVFGSLLSAVFLAEMPRTYHLIGGAVVIAGVLLAQGVLRRPGLRRAAAQKV
ncbi:DMT family transporter [Rhodovulum kholense]|uniref:EamA-like transporter family protein n=1 Tax=Rhodovulum kholense TaxID=453584 RepID=A0A8E3ARA8_9RHOB|nr:DMT family transporter [Rhodovulum kholense]PTW50676.1 EamA-like transporter family protein [Rhodovulum kholense]